MIVSHGGELPLHQLLFSLAKVLQYKSVSDESLN